MKAFRLFLLMTLLPMMLSGQILRAQESGPMGKLPKEDPPFKGTIGRTYKESKQDFIVRPKPPEGAPNVLVIMLDDVGYGQIGAYGGLIPTPILDRLAAGGLRYTRFHVTALCSPTRAAFLTGRTHHEVGLGVIGELSVGYPGYNGNIPQRTTMISKILKYNGYSTAAFGKWHLTPPSEMGPLGPFDRWPTGQGFEYFYGFLGGETSQWEPTLVENTVPIHPEGKDYHLSTDIADRAGNWIKSQHSLDPHKPFFLYWASGAMHAPHHVFKSYADKFKGRFDDGWDAYREKVMQRQVELGIIPKGTTHPASPKGIEKWESLSPEQKKVYARMMEVFAGFLNHTDEQIGKLLAALEETGQLDNTLIICLSDNGASAEGGLNGLINTSQYRNGFPTTLEEALGALETLGSHRTDNHYPAGWAEAGNAPFNYFKQAQHLGGIRVPFIVHWPKVIGDKGGIRDQYFYVSDVVPTILQATGIPFPQEVEGIKQKPLQGYAINETFNDKAAPSNRTTQYYEMLGHRGMYKDGWYAVTFHGRLPWQTSVAAKSFDDDVWELYNLNEDFSGTRDLAAQNKAKVEELKALWWKEAESHQVLPLDDRMFERVVENRKALMLAPRTFTYFDPVGMLPADVGPNVKNKTHTITADVTTPAVGQGLLLSSGGTPSGYVLYMTGGRVHFRYNYLQRKYAAIDSPPLAAGAHTVTLHFEADQPNRMGTGGVYSLSIDGAVVGETRLDATVGVSYASDETFDIGSEYGSPVVEDYEESLPFQFNGSVSKVVVDIK